MGMIIDPYRFVTGGGPPAGGDLKTVLGNANWQTKGATATGAGRIVRITTPSGSNCALDAVHAHFSSVLAGVGLKALLVADNGGVPGSTVIAVGTATVPGATSDAVVTMPFASTQTLSASTSYWVGFVPSASVSLNVTTDGLHGQTDGYNDTAIAYASPTAWNDGTDTVADKPAIWAIVSQAGAATGLHQQGSSGFFAGNQTMLIALPPHAIGDVIRIQHGQDFGTLPATPSGWTKTYDDQVHTASAVRHCIYERTIDGTETGAVFFTAPSGNNRVAVATVFRGGGAKEGKTVATGASTTATSAAVTTLGANRRVFNFLVTGFTGGAATNADTADSWTDVYRYTTTIGNDYTMSLSYKDQASAGSAGTESRTISSVWWHYTSFAVPDA